MKRIVLFCLASLVATASLHATVQGGAAQTQKTMSATGSVTDVSASSVTIKAKTEELTFAVDADTKVIASGASRKSTALKGEKKDRVITEFVKVGDTVAVKYHDMGATKHAAEVRVTKSAPPKK